MFKIWDLPIRIYHWLQAILFLALAISGFGYWDAFQAHSILGVVLFYLVIWRIGWGFMGSETARFTNFVPSPQKLWHYIKGSNRSYFGHSPLGGIMVCFMIILLLVQSVTGIATSEFINGKLIFGRGLIKTFKYLHEVNALVLLVCCLVHIIAIAIYKIRGKQLISAMFTGLTTKNATTTQPIFVAKRKAFTLFLLIIIFLICIQQLLN